MRRDNREALGLTQPEAAHRAGVSLATWRRWEEDPDRVKAKTRTACERVVQRASTPDEQALSAEMARYVDAWRDRWSVTPRQAFWLSVTIDSWAHADVDDWLRHPDAPLHEVLPFAYLDHRVLILVNENRAWVAKAQERMHAVAEEIANGKLPFDRPGCFFDELLMALALGEAQGTFADNEAEGFFDGMPARDEPEPEDEVQPFRTQDREWDSLSDYFDDEAFWSEWEIPARNDHMMLGHFMSIHPPHTWFDADRGYANASPAWLAAHQDDAADLADLLTERDFAALKDPASDENAEVDR